MNTIAALGAFCVLWFICFAVLFGIYFVIEVWIVDSIWAWRDRRKRQKVNAENHRQTLRGIDQRANQAVAELSIGYQRALIDIRRQRGRRD